MKKPKIVGKVLHDGPRMFDALASGEFRRFHRNTPPCHSPATSQVAGFDFLIQTIVPSPLSQYFLFFRHGDHDLIAQSKNNIQPR